MKLNFNDRLKRYLTNLIIREGDHEAWELLKTLHPNHSDLYTVITRSIFADEAWELLQRQSPPKDYLVLLVKHSDKHKEAAALLLQQQPLDNETLAVMVKHAGSEEAAKILLNQNPDEDQLVDIMQFTGLKEEAAAQLLSRPVENGYLIDIIDHSDSKMEAWEQLLRQSPANEDLIRIIQLTDWAEPAWEQLLKQNPTNEELMDLVNDYSETGKKRTEAAALILKQDPDIETLTHIIDNDQLTDEAWEILQKKSPTSADLGWLIWRANIKVNEAAALSMAGNPTKQELMGILTSSKLKEEAARLLVQMPLEITELVDVILYSNNKTAVDLLAERVKFDTNTVDRQKLYLLIKTKLLDNPELLNVNHWHNGDTHCFGGWAITLVEAAQEIEKQYGSEVAACLLLPDHTHLFFAGRETVLQALKDLGQPDTK